MIAVRYRAEQFRVDGALRDVVVLHTSVGDWQRMLSALPGSGFDVVFRSDLLSTVDGVPLDASVILNGLADGDHYAELFVWSGELRLGCYFFDDDEIEFTFDPQDVDGERRFADLERFLDWLSEACGATAIVTMETAGRHDTMPVLLSRIPSAPGDPPPSTTDPAGAS